MGCGGARGSFCQGVEQHGEQHQRQGLAQEAWGKDSHQPGARQRAGKTGRSGGQQGVPGQGDAAGILRGCHGRAPDRGAFVDAEQGGGVGGRKDRKQCRHQNQAAAANNRIHKTRQQRSQRDDQQFHGPILPSGRETSGRHTLHRYGTRGQKKRRVCRRFRKSISVDANTVLIRCACLLGPLRARGSCAGAPL